MRLCAISACYERPELSTILRESCAKFELPLHFCAAAELNGRFSGNFRISKLVAALEAMRELRGTYDFVAWADGFDTLVQAPPSKFEERYALAGSPELLLSAEKNCFPDPHKVPMYDAKLSTDSSYKYVNAGTWMGRVDFLIEKIQDMVLKYPREVDDQRMWTNEYLSDTSGQIKLDVDRWIFQTAWGTTPDELSHDCCVLHWNGGAWRNPDDSRYRDYWDMVGRTR